MHFSIWGVPFKCTKDMFYPGSLAASACIFWTTLWRFLLIIAMYALFRVLAGIWLEKLVGLSVAMTLVFAMYILAWGYWQYYALYKKRYQSFDRLFTTAQPTIKFFSWQFWKPYLIYAVIGILFNYVVFEILASRWADLLNLFFWMFLWHVNYHSGAWGFVPAPKKSTLTNN